MAQVETTGTMRVLGAEVQMQAEHEAELTQVLSEAWAAFHAKGRLLRIEGSLHAKLRIMQLSVYASFASASGARRWTAGEPGTSRRCRSR